MEALASMGRYEEARKLYEDTVEYYFSEPVVENEAKGVAPFLLAYTEMIRRK